MNTRNGSTYPSVDAVTIATLPFSRDDEAFATACILLTDTVALVKVDVPLKSLRGI